MAEILNLSTLCRCCHVDGRFKSVRESYQYKNAVEVYSAMLEETLGVSIAVPRNNVSDSICEECIVKLRQAVQFKQQITECEKKFLEYLQNEEASVLPDPDIKIEVDNIKDNENKVTLATFRLLDSALIKELIAPVGDRARFLKMLADWNELTESIEDEPSNCDEDDLIDSTVVPSASISNEDVTNKGDRVDHDLLSSIEVPTTSYMSPACASSSMLNPPYETTNVKRMGLKDLLKSSVDGRALINFYSESGLLTNKARNKMCNIIIKHILEQDPLKRISNGVLLQYSHEITEIFNKENASTYYIPYVKNSKLKSKSCAKGKLYVCLYNRKRDYKDYNNKYREQNLDEESMETDSDRQYIGDIDDVLWLKTSCEPWDVVTGKWKRTIHFREREMVNENYTADNYMDSYPALKTPIGFHLLTSDYDQKYPESSHKLKELFPMFEQKIIDFSAEKFSKYSDQGVKEFVDKYTTNLDSDRDYYEETDFKDFVHIKEEEDIIKEENSSERNLRSSRKKGTKKGPNAATKQTRAKLTTKKFTNKKETHCRTCDVTFDFPAELRRHNEEVHKHDIGPFRCPHCAHIGHTFKDMFTHAGTHGIEPVAVSCRKCDHMFRTRYSLLEHERRFHLKIKGGVCDICNKHFAYKCSLKKHLLMHQGLLKKHKCDLCNVSCNDRTNLRIHKDTVHYKIRRFACDKCDKDYTLKKHLEDHIIRDHADKQSEEYLRLIKKKKEYKSKHGNVGFYRCKGCPLTFTERGKFRSHTLRHAKEGTLPNICHVCGRGFSCGYSLRRHVDNHAGIRRHQCDICHKRFSHSNQVERHKKKMHNPVKIEKVKCHICKASCRDMEKHMKKHEIRPYSCEHCSKCYPEKNTLNRHVKQVHFGIFKHMCACGAHFRSAKLKDKHSLKCEFGGTQVQDDIPSEEFIVCE